MANNPCGGNPLDNFYSLFTCEHVNCEQCPWNLCGSCNGSNNCDDSCESDCLNFYDINLNNTICTTIKSFGYSEKHSALAVVFNDGTKKLYLDVDKSLYNQLLDLNKDLLYMFLKENVCVKEHKCIDIN